VANIEVTKFTGQNWLITPAALAVSETPPATIRLQKWLLVLSGSAFLDLRGTGWNGELPHRTIHISPDILGPCHHAIGRHGIPRPPGNENFQYRVEFQVEQWAPFVGMGGVFDKDSDVSVYQIRRWQPSPFRTGFDAHSESPVPLSNIFDGVLADVSVATEDAIFDFVSYNITLLGQIVFAKVIIT
jgi:hypothetical protein